MGQPKVDFGLTMAKPKTDFGLTEGQPNVDLGLTEGQPNGGFGRRREGVEGRRELTFSGEWGLTALLAKTATAGAVGNDGDGEWGAAGRGGLTARDSPPTAWVAAADYAAD
ncbi:unnamed protein product [Linum trigynum]|uniref:Uncharacterized protein n=1 Tax=Linum trigynum TaxID=586398 RepID=A0AAV2GI97_9ROSI